MKSKFLFVAAATLIVLSYVSCKWFESSKPKNELIGTWKAVNLADSSIDSTKNGMGLLGFALIWKDTLQFRFASDSVFVFTSKDKLDSGKYVQDNTEQTLQMFGKADTALMRYYLKNDTLELMGKDSINLFLKKIQ